MSGKIPTQGEALPNGPRRRGGPKMQAAAREELGPRVPISTLLPIKVQKVGDGEINAVNARDLYAFLGIEKDFTSWMSVQIKRARLIEHRDFETIEILISPEKGSAKARVRIGKEYALTLDAGKHIGMLSGTERGFEVREYFIESDKRLHAQPQAVNLNDPTFLRGALLAYTEKVLVLEDKVQELTPKADALDRIATFGDGSLCLTNAAKALQTPPHSFMAWLNAHLWIYRRLGGEWTARQERIRSGFMEHKIITIKHSDGREEIKEQALVTPKGLAKLGQLFASGA